jgi:hypothetical protein
LLESYRILAERIRFELSNVEKTLDRARRALAGYKTASENQDLFLDSMALGLHDFYTGLELVFSKIATVVDGKMPASKEWHRDLLVQMSSDIPTTRPPVISEEMVQNLDEYRRFRHVVRSVYSFNFDIQRIEPLIERSSPIFIRIQNELFIFAELLDRVAGVDS